MAQKIAADLVDQMNNRLVEDFLGLSPAQMHRLLYNPFAPGSVVQLNGAIRDEDLDGMPFFRLVEELLKIIQREEELKLTKGGVLTRNVLKELYGLGIYPERMIDRGISSLQREQDSEILPSVRILAELARLVRRRKGALQMTKEGKRLVDPSQRNELFRRIFESFTISFAWSYNDRYTEAPVGQMGWAFSVYLLHLHGKEEHPSGFYSSHYLRAFPTLITEFRDGRPLFPPNEMFASCYAVRVMKRFFGWFGLVEADWDQPSMRGEDRVVRSTGRVDRVFRFVV